MVDEKPLTKSDLVAVLKEVGVATQDDLQKLEERMKDHVFNTLTEFYAGQINPDLAMLEHRLEQNMHKGFTKVDQRLNKLEVEVRGIKDDIKGLEAELSSVPSRKQFNELKDRVDKYLPLT